MYIQLVISEQMNSEQLSFTNNDNSEESIQYKKVQHFVANCKEILLLDPS